MTKKRQILKLCNALTSVKEAIDGLRSGVVEDSGPPYGPLSETTLARIERNAEEDFRIAVTELERQPVGK